MKTILRLFTLLLLVAVAVDASAQGQPQIKINYPWRCGNTVYIPIGIKNIGDSNLRGEVLDWSADDNYSETTNADRRSYVIGSDSIDYSCRAVGAQGLANFNIPPGVYKEGIRLVVDNVPYDVDTLKLVKVALECRNIQGNTDTEGYCRAVWVDLPILPKDNTEGDSARCSLWYAYVSDMKCSRSGNKATLSFNIKDNSGSGTATLPEREWNCCIIGKGGTRYPAKFTQSSQLVAGQTGTYTVEISDVPSDLTELAYARMSISYNLPYTLTIEFWNIPVKKVASAPAAPRKKPGKKRKR